MDELEKKRFVWGAVLAWVAWVPTLIGLRNVFRGILEQKATGLGALAGGLSELFLMWGIGTMIISQVVAIIWLFRAFSPGRWGRSLFSVLSICSSGLMLLLVFLAMWFSWFHTS